MTKWGWFWLMCFLALYSVSAAVYAQRMETIISKHPLFIFSAIALAGLVLALRMEGKTKTVLLALECVILLIVAISNVCG